MKLNIEEEDENIDPLEKIIFETKGNTIPYISIQESNSLSESMVKQTCESFNEEYIQKIELLSKHINTRLLLLSDLKREQAKRIMEIQDDLYNQDLQRKNLIDPKLSIMVRRIRRKRIN